MDTFLTAIAASMVNADMVVLKENRILWTGIHTVMTVETMADIPKDLDVGKLAFRVGAPAAAERTAFKKHGCTDTWSVVDTEFLDIKNSSLSGSVCFSQFDPLCFSFCNFAVLQMQINVHFPLFHSL